MVNFVTLKALLYLNKYFRKHKWMLLIGVIFIICSNLFAILIAPIVRTATDNVVEKIATYRLLDLPEHFILGEVGRLALVFGGLVLASAVIKGVFMYFMRQTIIVVSRDIEYDLKNEIYAHYQKLNASFYGRNYTGDLMNRISEDVSRVRMYVGPALMYTINMVVLFVMVIAVMISINPKISLLVLAPLPFLSISIYFVSAVINRRSDRLQAKLSDLTTMAQEVFSGIRVVKSFSVTSSFTRMFDEESERYKDRYMDLAKVNALFFPLMLMLVGVSVIITIYAGGREVIMGRFSFGNIAEYIIYVNMLTWPVASLGWVTSIVQRAAASQKRINEFLAEEPTIVKDSNAPVVEFNDRIVFDHVSFTYPGADVPAIDDVSFEIKKGSTIGIIGQTGSGKSTVIQMLLRVYDVSAGSILIDGHNVKDISLKKYRELFGYVPQDVFLFSDTIYGNIVFGLSREALEGKDAEQLFQSVEKAARTADMLKDITDFPNGFDTILGERGISLSGGQRQRVAIARALVRDPEIVVLDDSLSAVDTSTEASIKKNLHEIIKNQTCIIVSHRISSIEDADHILVFENGKIVEQGKHDELIAHKGIYYRLSRKQEQIVP